MVTLGARAKGFGSPDLGGPVPPELGALKAGVRLTPELGGHGPSKLMDPGHTQHEAPEHWALVLKSPEAHSICLLQETSNEQLKNMYQNYNCERYR